MNKVMLSILFFAALNISAQQILFPLKASENKKYIVDANNNPVFLKGCATWRIGYNVTIKETKRFLEDRKSKDYNTLLVQISPDYDGGGNVPNIYGERLFHDGDVSKPNEKFFSHVDSVLQVCSDMNFAVILFPLYLGCCHDGWLEILQQKPNDVDKIFNYGKWVTNRYKKFPNLIWASGGDHHETPESLAFARGVAETDNTHLHLYHTGPGSTSTERLPDAKWLTLSATYTYFPAMDHNFSGYLHVYAQLYEEYVRNHSMPYIMFESAYEYERGETTQILRRQAYWSLLGGASGHLFGNRDLWRMNKNWPNAMNTPGNESMVIFHAFIKTLPWYTLQPDWMHAFFPSGRGTYNAGKNPGGEDYATGAFTPDATMAILYLPTFRTVSVNLERFEGPVKAEWFDPSTGSYTNVKGTFKNSRVAYLEPPAKLNGKGFEDWVLIVKRSE
jgi:hypothetical protein